MKVKLFKYAGKSESNRSDKKIFQVKFSGHSDRKLIYVLISILIKVSLFEIGEFRRLSGFCEFER